ncbi:predicted protein [Nematostella vectensis]|uniref:Uncharacterized protein n=1 Tax=Nematostella vectensis TaxID=45351 RepID=A7S580_NEMVE|nr:predicted protein [Nematostella vectensis]|eukprot:XP_001633219.1 predicted protein [Nematostella vectensis]
MEHYPPQVFDMSNAPVTRYGLGHVNQILEEELSHLRFLKTQKLKEEIVDLRKEKSEVETLKDYQRRAKHASLNTAKYLECKSSILGPFIENTRDVGGKVIDGFQDHLRREKRIIPKGEMPFFEVSPDGLALSGDCLRSIVQAAVQCVEVKDGSGNAENGKSNRSKTRKSERAKSFHLACTRESVEYKSSESSDEDGQTFCTCPVRLHERQLQIGGKELARERETQNGGNSLLCAKYEKRNDVRNAFFPSIDNLPQAKRSSKGPHCDECKKQIEETRQQNLKAINERTKVRYKFQSAENTAKAKQEKQQVKPKNAKPEQTQEPTKKTPRFPMLEYTAAREQGMLLNYSVREQGMLLNYSAREQGMLLTYSAREQGMLLTYSAREQGMLLTYSAREQGMLLTYSAREQGMLLTYSARGQGMLLTYSAREQGMLLTYSAREQGMLLTYSARGQACYSTIVHVNRACYSPIVHVNRACYSPIVYVNRACYSTIVHVNRACYSPIEHVNRACYSPIVHVKRACYSPMVHVNRACYLPIVHVNRACYSPIVHVDRTCYSPIVHVNTHLHYREQSFFF